MAEPVIASRISFREVRALAANEKWEKRWLNRLSKFLGAAILLTPASLVVSLTDAYSILQPKDELIKLGQALVEQFSKPRAGDFIAQRRRMTAAYCLMTYTAFFAALEEVALDLDLTDGERQSIAQDASAAEPSADQDYFTLIEISHPAMSPAAEKAARIKLYHGMAEAYLRFVRGLKKWEEMPAGERNQKKAAIQRDLPEKAAEVFEAQYLELILKYPDFDRWAVHYELTKSRDLSGDQISKVAEQVRLVGQAVHEVDVGLRHLHQFVAAGRPTAGGGLPSLVANSLRRVYADRILQPVIADQPAAPTALSYPKKCDIYVPQSFQTIRYLDPGMELGNEDNPKIELEQERTWDGVDIGQDIGAFTLRYLDSAYSIEAPLLVLGQPGAGKSLYTEMVAARFASPRYHPIRIELRDINADADLQEQIEGQILHDTGRRVNWVDISYEWRDNPPVVILDGYDELLQASGRVFSGYLKRVQEFQHREALHDRPVRVIVTSRITLVDKTLVPSGTTVVRLQDFDQVLRGRWIAIWNEANRAYFARTRVRPFDLDPAPGSSLAELAGQPLLLLMLAIYDSEANQLGNANLDRTLLYYRLLVRFIEREHAKGKAAADEFLALTPAERRALVESDLERLGVAALGMFNRRGLYIQGDELSKDLEYFGLARQAAGQHPTKSTQAEILFGSFFFLRRSQTASAPAGAGTALTAFDFLHNTFGEFLTADFIVRKVLAVTQLIRGLGDDTSDHAAREAQLAQPDDWLVYLVHTSLHTRPGVYSMMREWLAHRLQMAGRPPDGFEEDLARVTMRQLREVLAGNAATAVSRHVERSPYGNFSPLGHLAVYSLNLVLLRLALTRDDVVVDEESLVAPLAGSRPWDRLISLWRSWFSLESLTGLRSALQARRGPETIVLSLPRRALAKGAGLLEDTYNVADSLADDLVYGLAAPHVLDVSGVNRGHLPSDEARLSACGTDLSSLFAVRMVGDGVPWLRSLAGHMSRSGHLDEAEKLCQRTLEILGQAGDRIGTADTYIQLARLKSAAGQFPAAEAFYRKAIDVLAPLAGWRRIGEVERELSGLKVAVGAIELALGLSESAVSRFHELGDEPSEAETHRQLGASLLDAGHLGRAQEYLDKACEIFERLRYTTGIAETCLQLGRVAYLTGRQGEAEQFYEKAHKAFESVNDQLGMARTYVELGQVKWQTGRLRQAESDGRRAARIFTRAGAWRERDEAMRWVGLIAQGGEPGPPRRTWLSPDHDR